MTQTPDRLPRDDKRTKLSDLPRQKRMEFLSARFVAYSTGRKPIDRTKRRVRMHGRSYWMRMAANKRRFERFGLDITGDPKAVANERRVLRNARKRERQS